METHGKILKDANEFQNTANELQQQLINEIKTNNKVTSAHNKAMKWLTAAIVFLAVISLLTSYNRTGRYAISTDQGGKTFVLDTNTSKLWQRTTSGIMYLGTNKNPTIKHKSADIRRN